MHRIEKLIEKLCPEGVEYKKISDVCNQISSGGTPLRSKERYYNGNIPWLRTQEVDWGEINDTKIKITEEGLNNSSAKLIHKNCVIVAMYGATAAKVAINKIPLTTNQACCNLSINSNEACYKYVFYWLCNNYSILKGMGEGSQSNLNSKKIKNFSIPVPPLAIQEEIVHILDKFTALEAALETELEAELEARKKQYEYYRDELFSFDDEVEWKPIGSFAKLCAGATPKTSTKEYWENGTIPWMSSGEVNFGRVYATAKKITQKGFDNSSTKMVPANTVVVALAGQGKTRGTVAITMIPLCTNQSLCSIIPNETVDSNFLFYFLKTRYLHLRRVSSGDGTRGGLNLKMISSYLIPVPPLAEQERIVNILDRFDQLVNDISTGLPAEIAARRQQYEHYRNQLLTFKPLPHDHV